MPPHEVRFLDRIRELAGQLSDYSHVAENTVGALSGLFDLTASRLVRFSVTITRNQHDAEDAVQSVLVRVAGEPKLLARVERPWPYLLRMVHNESLMILRSKKRYSLLQNLSDLLTRCWVDEVQQEETHRSIWLALRNLPTEQSEVVVLKIWEDLTFAQIAEVLEISPSTAASRYRYALEKLSGKLRGNDVEVTHDHS